ncbi:Sel1 repeat-containing protein [Toxoplasma gondii]|uniref:Sel1 repeat-containing protein n=1 Tax=Toxoplasma gondii TaxID=5811 RepID=A0A7J6K2X2_TOXGO|nr:Sel1 repeat-containing protein [Toxoplasma gondii]
MSVPHLLFSRDDDLEKKECASRLCIEGHKNRFGYGVPTNLLRAFQLYTEAGRLGDLDALTCAGILLEEGLVDPGTDYDDLVSDLALTGSAARRYYEVAARQGHADALFRLGKMTEGGQGAIPADPVHAGKLYAEAAKLGHAEAQV